ncbi:hypothetical protein P030_06020 [Anaplasma phagocytophilum str. CRT35]|nr:hypothetical protein P030_06020 [Anaplasma phagocytophilum str. CRT35]
MTEQWIEKVQSDENYRYRAHGRITHKGHRKLPRLWIISQDNHHVLFEMIVKISRNVVGEITLAFDEIRACDILAQKHAN